MLAVNEVEGCTITTIGDTNVGELFFAPHIMAMTTNLDIW